MLNLKNIRLNIPHSPFKGGVRSHCGPLIENQEKRRAPDKDQVQDRQEHLQDRIRSRTDIGTLEPPGQVQDLQDR